MIGNILKNNTDKVINKYINDKDQIKFYNNKLIKYDLEMESFSLSIPSQ